MTATVAASNRIVGPPERSRLAWTVADAAAITRRNLRHVTRQPQLLIFSTVQPVMFVLLFNYVFGGAIDIPGVDRYIDFLIPGIFVQTTMFGATASGVGLAEDLGTGIIDRFRSLPMARSAVLAGRTLSDTVRTLFVVLLMTGVGSLIGFRFHAGLLPALGGLLLLLALGLTFSWVAALVGLLAKSPEAAQAGGFIWVFPLTFASSAFVSTETMPGWLRAFADRTPVTTTIDALRAMVLGGPTATPVLQSLAWLAAILAVAMPLAVRTYRKRT